MIYQLVGSENIPIETNTIMSVKKIIIGVMAGITTGTILGIMLQSKKSKTIRKKLLDDGRQYSTALKEEFNKSMGGIRSNFDKLYKGVDQPDQEEKSQIAKQDKKSPVAKKGGYRKQVTLKDFAQ
jgi:gas vesicle protein